MAADKFSVFLKTKSCESIPEPNLCPFHFCCFPSFTDVEVSCILSESCILPCNFHPGAETIIHWVQVAENIQLRHQNQYFRGRTSLFKDQISRGNASLQLTGVEVQDQGKYRCYTMISYPHAASTSSFLAAPVSKVNMEQVGNRIISANIQTSENTIMMHSGTLQLTHSLSVSEDSTNVGAIIGGVMVGTISVAAVAVVFLVLHCKKKRGKITFCLNFLIHFLFFVLMMMFLLSGRQRTNRRESKDDEIQT
uniref:Ig-like domain-containing protein n=1 Tax=Lates calcarifer TaxID=8187 RepID=A0A4W6BRB5_LATCA